MSDFEIRDLPEQSTALRRGQVPMAGLKEFFAESYRRLWEAIEAQGLRVAGPPFALYHGMPGEEVDVEAGFPVEGAFAGSDPLQAGSLPACRAVVGMHVGPYEKLPDTWMALQEWGRGHGLQPTGDTFWEVYVSDPGEVPDPSRLQTQLVQPVAQTA